MGQRLEDGSPECQNLAKPGFGLRQPNPDRGQAQSGYTVSTITLRGTKASGMPRVTRQLCLPAQKFFDLFGELNSVSDLAQIVAS